MGLIFRRAPFVRLPDVKTGVVLALQRFAYDVDLSGTTLASCRISRRWAWARRNSWRAGALSRDWLMDLFRRGEILPAVRTNAEESKLIAQDSPKPDGNEPKASRNGG